MDLASLSLGVSKFFFEDCFQTRQSVHDSQTHIIGVQSSLFEVFEELPPTGGGFLVAALKPKDCLKPIVRHPDDSLYWNIINAVFHTHFEVDAVNEEELDGFLRQITGPPLFN